MEHLLHRLYGADAPATWDGGSPNSFAHWIFLYGSCNMWPTDYRLSQNEAFSLVECMIILVLVWRKSIHLTKICAKKFYIFVPSDLDLWLLVLKFAPLLLFSATCLFSLKQKFVRLSCFEKIGGTNGRTDRQTDGRGATLDATPYGKAA